MLMLLFKRLINAFLKLTSGQYNQAQCLCGAKTTKKMVLELDCQNHPKECGAMNPHKAFIEANRNPLNHECEIHCLWREPLLLTGSIMQS